MSLGVGGVVDVVCPADAAAGAVVRVDNVKGEQFDVAVPPGVLPGDTFRVALPAAPPAYQSCAHTEEGGGGGSELEPRDPISDAPGGLRDMGVEMAGERALVAEYFGSTAVEVGGSEVLAVALRAVLRSVSRLDTLDELIEAHAGEFSEWDAAAEQRLEWTARFDEYVRLVDGGVSEALEDLECTAEQLFDYARCYHAESEQAGKLLARLLSMADYAQFCALMHEAHVRGGLSV